MNGAVDRILTDAAPAPAGHYAQATAWRDLVFASGHLGIRPDGSHTANEDFGTQARQARNYLLAALGTAKCGPDQVLRVTAYIVGSEHWSKSNEV